MQHSEPKQDESNDDFLTTSWPVSRILKPSCINEPKHIASAVAQSMSLPKQGRTPVKQCQLRHLTDQTPQLLIWAPRACVAAVDVSPVMQPLSWLGKRGLL